MIRNVGSVDKVVRVLLALVIAGLILADILTGTLAWVLGGIALLLVATSLVSLCPLYLALGISSAGKNAREPKGAERLPLNNEG